MKLEILAREIDAAAVERVSRLAAAYGDLLWVEQRPWDAARFNELWWAAAPQDGLLWPNYAEYAPDASGYEPGEVLPTPATAVGIWDRLVLLDGADRPALELLPGCWVLSFANEALLRGTLHRAIEQTLGRVAVAVAALERMDPHADPALALEVSAAALERCRWHRLRSD